MLTLVDPTRYVPAAIDSTAFPDAAGKGFWSSSAYVGAAGGAWYVNFLDGRSNRAGLDYLALVRCVH